jgi:hypothetical protein
MQRIAIRFPALLRTIFQRVRVPLPLVLQEKRERGCSDFRGVQWGVLDAS